MSMRFPSTGRVRELRKAAKLNQSDFAKRVGVPRSLISEWEGDKKAPTTEMYILLGNFAVRIGRREDAVWFWGKGKLKKNEVLSASSEELKKRRALPPAGEIVRVPPMREYEREKDRLIA